MKTKRIHILLLAVLLLIIFSGCQNTLFATRFFPESGTWYCEELQMHLRFEKNAISTAIIDGESVDCAAGYMLGSKDITITRENIDPANEWVVFAGEFVSLNDTELVLRNRHGGETYIFRKCDT